MVWDLIFTKLFVHFQTRFRDFSHRLANLYELVYGDDAVPVEVQAAEDVIHVGFHVLGTELEEVA